MNKTIKHSFSLVSLIIFFIFALGSTDDSSSSSSKSSSSRSSSSSSSSYSKPKKTCQDAYGNWRTYSLRCYTCGTSYCSDRSSLAYGKYCSQSCCAAYEGISSKCGY